MENGRTNSRRGAADDDHFLERSFNLFYMTAAGGHLVEVTTAGSRSLPFIFDVTCCRLSQSYMIAAGGHVVEVHYCR